MGDGRLQPIKQAWAAAKEFFAVQQAWEWGVRLGLPPIITTVALSLWDWWRGLPVGLQILAGVGVLGVFWFAVSLALNRFRPKVVAPGASSPAATPPRAGVHERTVTAAPTLRVGIERARERDGMSYVLRVDNESISAYEVSAIVTFLYGTEREIKGDVPHPIPLPVKGMSTTSVTIEPQGTARFLFVQRTARELVLYFGTSPASMWSNWGRVDTYISPESGKRIECEVEFALSSVAGLNREGVGRRQRYSVGWDSVEERPTPRR
jgi:hypothetical protein